MASPDPSAPGGGFFSPDQYTQYIDQLAAAADNASGFRKLQLQAQMEDAEKGRKNAMALGRLQAETSRYGVDAQRATAMAQLKENARQFDLTHALDMKRFGLDVAKTYTSFAQTYDDLFALQDLKGALGSIDVGQGPQPLVGQGQPHAKNWNDFAALTGFGGGPVAPALQPSASSGGAPTVPMGAGSTGTGYNPRIQPVPSPATGAGQPQAGTQTDPRVTAANAVMKAIPPSQTMGADNQDWAAIAAIQNLYFAGRPGDVEKLGAERQKAAMGALNRAGFNSALVAEERRRSLPGQMSPFAA